MQLIKKVFHAFDKYMSQCIILFGVFVILVYTLMVLYVTFKTDHTVPDSLTNGVFGFFGLEFVSLAGIKVTKYFRAGKSIESAVNGVANSILKKESKED